MQTTSILSRTLSAALAVLCGAGVLVVLGEQLHPARLAATPQVIEFEPVTVTAKAPAAGEMAATDSRTRAN